MDGKGELRWPNEQRYEGRGVWGSRVGQFEEDERSGYGVFFWEDRRVFRGFWKNGKQNGAGVLVDSDGTEYHGEWHHGKQAQNVQE